MKILRNKTHYTIKKGMGDIVIGEIIHFEGLGCRVNLVKDLSPMGLDIKDIELILLEMKKIEKEFKK